ncbi:phytoene desaturase family protein [Microbacterium gorillae]|uniref:phytoene desaturase family protein n=1 Tax=Microbacterium gorillae TaxID=1231063 RepID=UPI00058E2918|nr:phytoene desaturase family protein [Microbacterium gorillae]
MSRVVIVGGGVSGLVSAALLAREGHRVTLLEQGAAVGGRAGIWRRDGFTFDTGPSWFLMREVFEHTYRMLGTTLAAELELRRLDPAYRIHLAGDPEPFEVSGDYAVTRERFEARERGAGAALDAYVASAREATTLAEERFLWNRFDRLGPLLDGGVLRRLPRLGGLLTRSLDGFVRGRFRDAMLQRVLGYPAVFLGTRPERAPALYHLMSSFDLDQGVFYPMGGFGAVIASFESLARDAGVAIRTGTRAMRIRLHPGVRRVAAVSASGPGGALTLPADRVVVACDQGTALPALIPEIAARVHRRVRRAEPGPGAVLVMLGVRGRLPLTHHTLVLVRDWSANFDAVFRDRAIPDPASLYVCAPSVSDPSVAPGGTENLFLLVPVGADPELGSGGEDGTGDERIERAADAAITALADAIGVPDLAERIIVRRTVGPTDMARDLGAWRGGALGLAHTLGQSAMLRGSVRSPDVRGLYTVGSSSVPGIGVPMCLISAELLLKHARDDHSAGPLPEPVT